MKLAIFGAQGYALGVYEAMRILYSDREISFFVVSKMGNNAKNLVGIPVREIASVAAEMTSEEKKDLEVLIGTPENIQSDIEEVLENYGFKCHNRVTSEKWKELMDSFHQMEGKFKPLASLSGGSESPFVRIFMAKSEKDVALINPPLLPDYILPVQAGAETAKVKVASRADNTGENISAKNGNYCELTALYWMWKNKLCAEGTLDGDDGQYYGLSQYRRMLILSDNDLLKIRANDVDVVLPYPLPYEPDIQMHHERYLKANDWNAMLGALKELQPEYAEYFPQVLGQRYLYNYNVILAKKKVLREYCEWLFPILKRTEELSVPKGDERSDRYIGYMGETLETLYFMKNADRLKIVHTGCKVYT